MDELIAQMQEEILELRRRLDKLEGVEPEFEREDNEIFIDIEDL